MADEVGRVVIPIEISPQDTREINQLLERIERAEAKLNKINNEIPDEFTPSVGGGPTDIKNPMSEQSHNNPRRRRKSNELPDIPEEDAGIEAEVNTLGFLGLAGGAPIQPKGGPNGPIFRGYEESPDVVQIYRSGKKSQPIQRQDMFKNLTGRVDDLETKVSGGNTESIESHIGTATSIIKNPTGFFMGMIQKLAPIIGPIIATKVFIDVIIEELTRPGGLFDRRFKIDISKQVVKTMDRDKLKAIRSGLTEVRVTSASTLRGERGNIANNLSIFQPGGKPVYDISLENYSKGGMQ
jgi:tetrahydromethanopterin S-methyltransferase subunit G